MERLEEREPYWVLVDEKAETNNTIDLDAYANGVQDGVKWQQGKMYSEKEVFKMFASLLHTPKLSEESSWEDIAKWFEQFKK